MGCGETADARWARVSSATFLLNVKVFASLDGAKECLMVTSPTSLGRELTGDSTKISILRSVTELPNLLLKGSKIMPYDIQSRLVVRPRWPPGLAGTRLAMGSVREDLALLERAAGIKTRDAQLEAATSIVAI